ncbi:MAG: hypothetical protein O7G84_00985 [Gammaproteobacteria bacterium]|nr:hypothetical protein [Gammaproteobacteria bacterium]
MNSIAEILAHLDDDTQPIKRADLAAAIRRCMGDDEPKRLWHRVFATNYALCKDYDQAMETADNAVEDGKERFP